MMNALGAERTRTVNTLRRSVRTPVFCSFLAFALSLGSLSLAQTPPATAESPANRRDPLELIHKAVQNELRANQGESEHFMFRGVKAIGNGSATRLYAETREGTAGLVIAYDGKALTPDQQKGEQARLQRFIDNPDELRKKRGQERENSERTTRIMRALPDAFLYDEAGEETGSQGIGRTGDPLVRLRFRPNPKYDPPSRVEEVLTGMQGEILVDAVHYRIASIDGTLFKSVGFGWGILGHLDKGGRFVVHQECVNNVWEISTMTLHFTGKILLFKSLNIDSTEVYSNFKRIPTDLTFAQAVELLKKEETALADNGTSQSLAEKKKR